MIESLVSEALNGLTDPSEGYVSKTSLGYFQLIPVPEDLENWYKVPYDPTFDYSDKVYSPEEEKWILSDTVRVTGIKSECKRLIYERYNQEKQNNIAFLPDDDETKIIAVAWINAMRDYSAYSIEAGTLINELVWPE